MPRQCAREIKKDSNSNKMRETQKIKVHLRRINNINQSLSRMLDGTNEIAISTADHRRQSFLEPTTHRRSRGGEERREENGGRFQSRSCSEILIDMQGLDKDG